MLLPCHFSANVGHIVTLFVTIPMISVRALFKSSPIIKQINFCTSRVNEKSRSREICSTSRSRGGLQKQVTRVVPKLIPRRFSDLDLSVHADRAGHL